MDQALVTWPGVERFVSFSGTLQHGITPSVFSLTIAPQSRIVAATGDLVITFGKTKVTLKDCIVDEASYQFDDGGYLVGLQILDRRWKWRYGKISGRYNQTDDAGQILSGAGRDIAADAVKNSERDPLDLAIYCLLAMGEKDASATDLPGDTRPSVDWDYANPAKSLAEICEACGCRVVLGLDNKVRVRKLNVGKPLPNLPFVDAQAEANPPEKPDKVTIVTAPVQVQWDFKLEAVGLDTDGKIKPIDELSYKPTAGWGAQDPDTFVDLTDADDPEVRNLALESVYKWYRIILEKDIVVPTGDGKTESIPLRHREQIDLLPEQVDRDSVEGEKRKIRREAWCYGVWYIPDPKDWMSTSTTERGNSASTEDYITRKKDARLVTAGFSIDTVNRVVRFSEPIYRQPSDGSATFEPATIRLRTACHVRKATTGELIRMEIAKPTPKPERKTKEMIVIRDDLEPTLIQRFEAQGNVLTGFGFIRDKAETNSDDIIAAGKVYADHAIRELGVESPESRKYPGIVAIEPDGAIQAIAWSIGQNGAFTTIQRNHDYGSETCIPYKLRRQLEVRAAFQQVTQNAMDLIARGTAAAKKFFSF